MNGVDYKIAPSIFAADLRQLENQIHELELTQVDLLHVDVMDGHFVDKMAFGPDHVAAIKRMTSLPLDVHLMVDRPERILDSILSSGADIITFHVESTARLTSCIERTKKAGRGAGIVLCPSTSPNVVDDSLLSGIDMILQMTINPGESGQSFHMGTVDKIRRIREWIGQRGIDLEVDGGVDARNAKIAAHAGANVLVSGGFLFEGNQVSTRVAELRAALEQVSSSQAQMDGLEQFG